MIVVTNMKNTRRFNPGDTICSEDGDIGIVREIGLRPDVRTETMGVYAFWLKENLAFWMDMDEPSIDHYESNFWRGNLSLN